jgi:superoxide dismutase, Cu-Zn family
MKTILLVTVAAALSGCATMNSADTPDPIIGTASINGGTGNTLARATITTAQGAMRLTVSAEGMAPGTHGLHIHTVGRCDAPDFKTAGDHWNPDMKQHGRDNPMGAHRGDLPNLVVGADGRGTVSFGIDGAPAAVFDTDGASIIVHAAADDYKTDPSGSSGSRIACGVFVPA